MEFNDDFTSECVTESQRHFGYKNDEWRNKYFAIDIQILRRKNPKLCVSVTDFIAVTLFRRKIYHLNRNGFGLIVLVDRFGRSFW